MFTCSILRLMYDSGRLENFLVSSPTLLRSVAGSRIVWV